jgi:hypothetical protein
MPVIYICPHFLKSEPEVFYEGCASHLAVRDSARGYEIVLGERDIPESVRNDVEVIFGVPNATLLPSLPSLKWLQLSIAGSDRYCARNLYANNGVILTNSSGVFGRPISEICDRGIPDDVKESPYHARQYARSGLAKIPLDLRF